MTAVWRINDPHRKRSDSKPGSIFLRLKPTEHCAFGSDLNAQSGYFGCPSADGEHDLSHFVSIMSRSNRVAGPSCIPTDHFLVPTNLTSMIPSTFPLRFDPPSPQNNPAL